MTDRGLLFVPAEVGPDASAEEFNDWYDNEHGPLRLTVPGFHSAIRYKATDGQIPSWLALYDLESPSVARSESYKSLAAKASDKEKALIPRLATLDRRIYEQLSERTKPDVPSTTFPAAYILVVGVLVPSEFEEELNKWYEEEHIGEVAKTPGWLRGRFYKLVDQIELTGKVDPAKKIHNYVALNEFENDEYTKTPEFTAAVSTPWSKKVLGSVNDIHNRRFALYKNLQKPQ